jgi:ethanolamine ammonia-lyase small subunit
LNAPNNDERKERLDQISEFSEVVKKVFAKTPARLLKGRSGASYLTNTQMDLREAHAAARDAVRDELNLFTDFGNEFVQRWSLFEASSQAVSKDEYLARPDLGRRMNEISRAEVIRRCNVGHDLQVVIGDGLSATAVAAQVPRLLPLLSEGAISRGWSVGSVFMIRHCRVGIINEIGELLSPRVVVLLIGERPGLATAESLSAYLAYRPEPSHTDADRNLVSNIHDRGVSPREAAQRILDLAAQMTAVQKSGWRLSGEQHLLGSQDKASKDED